MMKSKKDTIKQTANKKAAPKKQVSKTVTVIGLGYVGLPLACLCVEKGFKTYGVDKDRKKINMLNRGVNYLTDAPELDPIVKTKKLQCGTNFEVVKKSDIIVICVPTPVDEERNPDLTPVKDACKKTAKFLKKGQLVILESTINPGVCDEIVKPLMDSVSGIEAGKDYYLAHSPERVNPGDPKWKVRNIPRTVGAISPKGLKMALAFYNKILDSNIMGMNTIKEAEATKVIENSFRDINIAFVNELAKSFDKMGIDLYEVLKGAATKPFAYLPHWPSLGVGGHCIPVDPYYLIKRAQQSGFDHKFLKMSREINNSMPSYTVGLLSKCLNEIQRSVKGTTIGVLGLSYKGNVADKRESPAVEVVKLLKERQANVEIYDPYLPEDSTVKSLDKILKKSEAIVVASNHEEFKLITAKDLKKNGVKVVVDGKNILNKKQILKAGMIYKGIGR